MSPLEPDGRAAAPCARSVALAVVVVVLLAIVGGFAAVLSAIPAGAATVDAGVTVSCATPSSCQATAFNPATFTPWLR